VPQHIDQGSAAPKRGDYEPGDRHRSVDHIGIRVRNIDRALNFYRVLGFNCCVVPMATTSPLSAMKPAIELNLVFNANAGDLSTNVLMDTPDKYPGYKHVAFRVASIPSAIAALKANDIAITQDRSASTAARHPSLFAIPIATLSGCAAVIRVLSKASSATSRRPAARATELQQKVAKGQLRPKPRSEPIG